MRPRAIARSLCLGLGLSLSGAAALDAQAPSIQQVVSLERPGAVALAPDGRFVAYTLQEADWDNDLFVTEIWLADVRAGTTRRLTTARKTSQAPAWSPDGRRLAFLSNRAGAPQVYLIDPFGGEAEALTRGDRGVQAFAWSPDGPRIAYTVNDPRPKALDERDKQQGAFEIEDEEPRRAHLHVIDVETRVSRRLTEGPYSVSRFDWAPDGRSIAFDHRPSQDASYSFDADISIVSIADGKVRPLVARPSLDENPVWSPDGTRIAFLTTLGRPDSSWDTPAVVAVIPAAGGAIEPLSEAFDNNPYSPRWGGPGIFFWSLDRAAASLYLLDPDTKRVSRVGPAPGAIGVGYSFDRDFTSVAYVGSDAAAFAEVSVAGLKPWQPKRVTDLGAQVAGWPRATRELVTWKSRDGTLVEGVLHKPPDFQPGRRYPLLVRVHGGPTTAVFPAPYSNRDPYPIDQWLNRGALILEPNYRGSAGYGARFRSLNVGHLGIGDAWDVLSGVDDLVEKGLADTERVGCMGWSQGGYISAFLATHDSARFKAFSVGAGISDWITYYVNTDLHPFTVHFLKGTPWDNPQAYATASPMTYIKQARTPTLIQHGGNDPRVPPANAFELYQGLKDQKVPTRLIIYKGFGHTLTKPKAMRAAMEHNLAWFNHYLWGDPGEF